MRQNEEARVDHLRLEAGIDRRRRLKFVGFGTAVFTLDTALGVLGTDEAAAQPASRRGRSNRSPGDIGVVRIGIANDAQSGDGALTGGGSWPVTAYVYNSLLQRNSRNGRFSPSLATSWKATDGTGRIWEYELRRGVKFHDGTETHRRRRGVHVSAPPRSRRPRDEVGGREAPGREGRGDRSLQGAIHPDHAGRHLYSLHAKQAFGFFQVSAQEWLLTVGSASVAIPRYS
jgi:hypothetical protein